MQGFQRFHSQMVSLVAIATSITALSVGSAVQATPLSSVSLSSYTLAQSPVESDDATIDDTTVDDSVPEASSDASGAENVARFTCQFQDGEYRVMYSPESQPGQMYPWAAPGDMGGGWSAERRCIEISRRLEEYRPDGLLELRTSVENGYDIVCATTEQDSLCRIVFTVPEGQDPVVTRDRVFENLAVANSGQSTTAVSTFTGDRGAQILDTISRDLGINLPSLPGTRNSSGTSAINLRPFLDPADGGTGTQLQSSTPAILNPDDFR